MEGGLVVLVIDQPEADLLAVDDLVVVILPEQGHRRLPGHELSEDLAVTLVVLHPIATTHLPRQPALADEDTLRGQAGLGRELRVDVVQRRPNLFQRKQLAIVSGVGDEIDVHLGQHCVYQALAAVLHRVADAVDLGIGVHAALGVRHFGAGVVDGLLADAEPFDHRRKELRRGVLLHILIGQEIPVSLPVANEEGLTRRVVTRE